LSLFNFGSYSQLYRNQPIITSNGLEKGKLKIAAELQAFTRVFGVLVGNLIPDCNRYWKLYLCLQRVLDFVLSKNLPKSCIETLKLELSELGNMRLSFERHFTFKFHKVLCHYPSIIDQSGPIPHLSVRRCKSKHRELNFGANANMSRVNLTKSLAVKHQLGLCYRLMSKQSYLR